MSESNVTITANAKVITYNIAYNLDDGQTTEDNPVSYDVTSATITLKNPTKTGYTFVGWSGTGLTGNTNTTVSIARGSTGDREYTANWSINSYNLTINKTTGINTVTGDGLHEYNSSITASCTMLAGYEFDKWTGDFTTETFAMPANNATMTANAKPIVYNITYSGIDGATFATANPTSYDITSATITLNNPTKANHLFVGWTEGTATFPVRLGQITNGSTEDKTFTAHFLEILTFNLSGGVPLVMHKCPAGSFMMGSPDDELGHQSNETYHKVTLTNDFYIGKFEVTQEQYYAVMESNPSNFTGDNSRPVEQVSYDDLTKANGFLAILNASFSSQLPDGYHFALPTEAQWEYACRAGTGTSLNNGTNITQKTGICDNLDKVGWYDKNSGNTTKPVGQKLPNAWGLYDMHGNVYEWCRDGFADYTSQEENPIGVNSNDNYVNRGGSGENPASNCRSAFRNYQWKRVAVGFIGFRVALVKD